MEHAHLDAVLTTFQCSNPPRIRDCSAHVPKQACSGRDEISLQSKSRSDRGAELIDHSVSFGLQTDGSCEGSHSLSDYKPRKGSWVLCSYLDWNRLELLTEERLKQTQRLGRSEQRFGDRRTNIGRDCQRKFVQACKADEASFCHAAVDPIGMVI